MELEKQLRLQAGEEEKEEQEKEAEETRPADTYLNTPMVNYFCFFVLSTYFIYNSKHEQNFAYNT